LPTLRRSQLSQNTLRQRTNFTSQFNVIWAVQIARRKYSASHFPQISSMFAPSRLIEEGRTRRHDTWSAGCGGRDGARAREALQGGLKLCLGAVSDRSAQDERRSSRTAKACGSGTRGWCQAGGGCSNPTGFDQPSIRQRWRQKEFVSRESAP
jgi:hypothetical protein